MNLPLAAMWPEERIAELKQLWDQGLSCALIAKELGRGTTRNAVIGKLHRLGLSRPKPAVQQHKQHPRHRPTKQHVIGRSGIKKEPCKFVSEPQLDSDPCTFLELTSRRCHWPLGKSHEKPELWCGAYGADYLNGRPYCEFHTNVSQARPRSAMQREATAVMRGTRRKSVLTRAIALLRQEEAEEAA